MSFNTSNDWGALLVTIGREPYKRDKWVDEVAGAIILQAAKDYRSALRGETVDHKAPEIMIKECEKFFRSEWFSLLTKLKGETLIRKLQEEYRDECNTRSANRKPHRNNI